MMIAIGYGLVTLIVFVDQISKYILSTTMKLGESITIIPGIIDFHTVYNTGAAFSSFDGQRLLLATVSFLAVPVIAYFMKDINFKKRPLFSYSLVLIMGGTIGNLIDRIFNPQGVFDFIEFTFVNFAVFNVADSCLTIGAILLGVYLIFFEEKERKANAKL